MVGFLGSYLAFADTAFEIQRTVNFLADFAFFGPVARLTRLLSELVELLAIRADTYLLLSAECV